MKLDSNFIYIAGYAGHGKDTAKNIMFQNYDNLFKEISMAETLKFNATSLITDNFRELTGQENKLDALNAMKDLHPDVEFFAGLSTRSFLQKLGTEYYRAIYDDIHANFVALKVLNYLENTERQDVVFVACDVRFPNELNFMLKMSQLKNDDLKDYLRFLLNNVKDSLPNEEKFISHFEDVFNVDRKNEGSKLILSSILSNIELLNNTKENLKEWKLDSPSTANMSKDEAIKYGLLHVFRPILNPNITYDQNLKSKDIVEEIKKYTGLEYGKIADVMKYYKISEVDFNIENIVKYGYVRADLRHPSENAINNIKPEAILSTPLKDNLFESELLNLLKVITIKDDLITDNKKKNLLNRGVQ
jgi:hypothetical protein